jgi:hypothetical protein
MEVLKPARLYPESRRQQSQSDRLYTERARDALRSIILWPQSVTAFQNADLADNGPERPVDRADLASGISPVDAGPGVVGGNPFAHRVSLPAEPNPM